MKNLIETEAEGLESLAAYHRSTRQAELERQDRHGGKNLVAEYNGWKGYVPAVRQDGAEVIIADDSKNYDLLDKGYVRIGDYKGDTRENYQGKRGYYQSSVGGQNPFRQGVLTYCKTERSSQPDAHVKDIVKIHPIPSLTKQTP